MSTNFLIRKASEADLEAIYELTLPFVESRQLLRRSVDEIRSLIANGFTAVRGPIDGQEADLDHGDIVGFAAVEIYSNKLAEILCLAVSHRCQGHGLGKLLVQHCVQFAHENGVKELMAISSSDNFLKNCGFDYTLPDQKRALFIDTSSSDRFIDISSGE